MVKYLALLLLLIIPRCLRIEYLSLCCLKGFFNVYLYFFSFSVTHDLFLSHSKPFSILSYRAVFGREVKGYAHLATTRKIEVHNRTDDDGYQAFSAFCQLAEVVHIICPKQIMACNFQLELASKIVTSLT